MKKFKFINEKLDNIESYCAFNYGQIYDGDDVILNFQKVSSLAKHDPNSWEEIGMDKWNGAVFAKVGLIHKIERTDKHCLFFDDGSWAYKRNCKPSTEEEYIKQMKKK